MNNKLRVVLVQYDVQWHNIKANLKKIDNLLESIDSDFDLIVLPEMFATGFTMQPELFNDKDFESIRNWMNTTSAKFNSAIMGSNPERDNSGYFNRLHFYAPGGSEAMYDKRHLFAMGDETKHYVPGNKLSLINFHNWNLLPLICYDLRFPVWSRNVSNKYDLLIYVANWPAVRNEVWETLLKARAIENQCYTIGINRIGKDNSGIEYIGNSQLISPRGQTLIKLGNEEGILAEEINRELLHRFRSSFPVAKDADDFIIK